MVDNLNIALQFKAAGVPKTVGDVRKITAAVEKIREENDRAAKTARILADAYGLSADELNQVNAALKQVNKQGSALQSVFQGIGQQLGQQLLATTQQAVTGVPQAALQSFRDYDAAVRQSAVISGASAEEIELLRAEIERLGIVTSATPEQIARTSVALSRAGFTATEQAEAFEGIVRASEATGESLELVGEVVGTTLRTFGLAADQSQRVADILVSSTNSTNTSVESLAESLKFVGPAAAAAEQPLEDVSILIGLLGDQGIQGSQAGTNLAAALERLKIASAGANTEFSDLVRGSAKQTKAFEAIGTEVRNADGSLKSVLEILPIVQSNLAELGQQDQEVLLKALFGVEGGRAFQALLNTSEQRIKEVTATVRDSQGVAVESGEALLQGLDGALKLFEGSLGGASAEIGEFLATGVEPLVRGATLLLNTFLALPAPLQTALIASTAFTSTLVIATAALAAYNLASGKRLVQDALTATAAAKNTIATAANTAAVQAAATARALLAVVTGQATAAQVAQTQSVLAGSVALAAFAGAVGSVALVANTFREVTQATRKASQTAEELRRGLEGIDGTDSGEEAAQNIEDVNDGLSRVEQTLDKVRERIPGLATSAEAAANNSIIAFNKIISATDDIRLAAAQTAVDLEKGVELDEGVVQRTVENIDAATQTLREQQPVTEETIQRRDVQIAQLEEYRSRILATSEGVTALTEATGGLKDRLEELNNTLATGTAAIEGAGAAATAQLEEQRAAGLVGAEDYQRQLASIEQAGLADRIALNRKKLVELRELESAADGDALADVQSEIQKAELAINKDRIAIAKQTSQQIAEARKAEEKAAKEAQAAEIERLKALRDAAVEAAEARGDALRRQREDEATGQQRQFDEQNRTREQQFAEQQRQADENFAQAERQADEQFEEAQRDREQEFNDRQRQAEQEFQSQLEAREQQFSDRQRQAEAAFQDQIQAERDQGGREFDALDAEVERRIALAEAATKEEREAIEARIEAEEKAAELRREVEADVLRQRQSVLGGEETDLSPLEQARADFEAGLQAKETEFQAQQQAAKQVFEDAQRAAELVFEETQRTELAAFQERERQTEAAFQETQRQAEAQFRSGQRTIEAAFQESQRVAEANFKDQQRQLDRQNAAAIAKILEDARSSVTIPGRAKGGPVAAGQPYIVGERGPELIFPNRAGHVFTAAQTAKMLGRVGGLGAGVVSSTDTKSMERKLDQLIAIAKRRPKLVAPATINLGSEATQFDAIQAALDHQRAQFRGLGF